MKPARFRLAFAACGLILIAIGHFTTEAPAAPVSVRLGTGLAPTDTRTAKPGHP